jgi:hypothetical protein
VSGWERRVCAILQRSRGVVSTRSSRMGVSKGKRFGVQVRLMYHRALVLRKVVSNGSVGIGFVRGHWGIGERERWCEIECRVQRRGVEADPPDMTLGGP